MQYFVIKWIYFLEGLANIYWYGQKSQSVVIRNICIYRYTTAEMALFQHGCLRVQNTWAKSNFQ